MKWISALVLASVLAVSAAGAEKVGRRPVVGVVDTCSTSTLVSVGNAYVEAVYRAGACPYVLPASTNAQIVAALLDRIDMLLLCGGEDVDPARYGEKDRGVGTEVNAGRDAWEFALLDEAVRRRMPILGICRGCQVLNVRFGGTLWQDIPTEVKGAGSHRIKGEHGVSVEAGSFLAKVTQGLSTTVNSRHHQAVRKIAPGFQVTARSADGVVEAIEGREYPALGVQFHPEKMLATSGRTEFLPLFRGAFANVKPGTRALEKRKRLVAIPDYCATNSCVVAKQNLISALEKADFVAVVIPFTEDDAALEAALADADALMVGGGIGQLQDYARRCAFEHRAIRRALGRGIPIAGVCHGSQVINTCLGGTLMTTEQKQNVKGFLVAHRTPVRTPYTDNFHLADLEPGSRIARVLGSTRAVVNSSHSNRSFEMGTGLKVTARALDGVVEAFEHETLPIMAFQFHPERMAFDRRFVDLLRESLCPVK